MIFSVAVVVLWFDGDDADGTQGLDRRAVLCPVPEGFGGERGGGEEVLRGETAYRLRDGMSSKMGR